MCAFSPYSNVTEEDMSVMFDTSWYSIVGGACIGGLVGMRESGSQHILENRDTRYESKYHAQKHLNQTALQGFMRYSGRWGLKAGFVGTLFWYLVISSLH
jgi:hypothetical protein